MNNDLIPRDSNEVLYLMKKFTDAFWEFTNKVNEDELLGEYYDLGLEGNLCFISLLFLRLGSYYCDEKFNIFKSLKMLTLSIKSDPENSLALNKRGEILHSIGLDEKARLDFEKAIETDRLCVEAYVNLGQVLLVQERFEAANTLFDKGFKIVSKTKNLYYDEQQYKCLVDKINNIKYLSDLYKKYIYALKNTENSKYYMEIKYYFKRTLFGNEKFEEMFYLALARHLLFYENYFKTYQLVNKLVEIKRSKKLSYTQRKELNCLIQLRDELKNYIGTAKNHVNSENLSSIYISNEVINSYCLENGSAILRDKMRYDLLNIINFFDYIFNLIDVKDKLQKFSAFKLVDDSSNSHFKMNIFRNNLIPIGLNTNYSLCELTKSGMP